MHACGKGARKCRRLRIKIVECEPTYFTDSFKYSDFLAKLELIFRFCTCDTYDTYILYAYKRCVTTHD